VAGSTLTLDRALRNIVALDTSGRMRANAYASIPALLLGIEFKKVHWRGSGC